MLRATWIVSFGDHQKNDMRQHAPRWRTIKLLLFYGVIDLLNEVQDLVPPCFIS